MPAKITEAEDSEHVISVAVRQRVEEADESTQPEKATAAEEQVTEKSVSTKGVTIMPLSASKAPVAETQKPQLSTEPSPRDSAQKTSEVNERPAANAAATVEELVASKKYFLEIKEKRYRRSSLRQPKSSTLKHNEPQPQMSSVKRSAKANHKTSAVKTAFIAVLLCVVLVVVAYTAVDLKLVDVGWQPPFSIFNR